MTALSRSIGDSLFDSNLVFDKRASRVVRPADGLRALQRSLTGDPQQARRASLPDFLAAAQPAAQFNRVLETPPAAFSVTRAEQSGTSISIASLATAASARSTGFSSLDDQVTAGTLSLKLKGQSYAVTIAQGATLKDVANSVRGLGADVDASIEREGAKVFLQIKRRSTGYSVADGPDAALSLSETVTGTDGQRLGAEISNVATNAVFSINGVTQVRAQNLITDAQSGTSIDLARVSAGIAPALAPDAFTDFGASKSRGTGQGFLVSVESLSRAAEARSGLFRSENELIKAGTLALAVEGRSFNVAINDGDTLGQVRQRIEASGADVRAALVADSGGVRLSLTSRQTGYPLRGRPEDALAVSETSTTGAGGQSLGLSITQAATNAVVKVNGAATSSRTDDVTGAVPGFTLSLKKVSSSGELVTLPVARGRTPVDVGNEVNRVLQAQLLTTRVIAPPQEEEKVRQTRQKLDVSDKVQEARKPIAGSESSRADILKKLTAVDDIFGGLKATGQFLESASANTQ